MSTVLLVILVILLLGGLPQFGLHQGGYALSGGAGIVLVVLLILLLLGRI